MKPDDAERLEGKQKANESRIIPKTKLFLAGATSSLCFCVFGGKGDCRCRVRQRILWNIDEQLKMERSLRPPRTEIDFSTET